LTAYHSEQRMPDADLYVNGCILSAINLVVYEYTINAIGLTGILVVN